MQIIVYHSKARKTMCGMGTFCLIGMISLQLTIQNGEAVKNVYPNIAQYKVKGMLINTSKDHIIVVDGDGKEYRIAISTST